MKVQKKQVNSLYYGKYPYCLTFKNEFFAIFRNTNMTNIRVTLDILTQVISKDREERYKPQEFGSLPKWLVHNIISKPLWKTYNTFTDAKKLYNFLLTQKDNTGLRVEYPRQVTIYSADKDILIDIAKQLHADSTLHEPREENLAILLSIPDVQIVKRPTDYQYKVLFKSGTKDLAFFGKWCMNNSERVSLTHTTLNAMLLNYLLDGLSFKVKDDKTLTLVNLMIGQHIGRVKKLVFNDKY